MTKVKICGLKDPSNLQVAIDAGADYAGFVFYDPSPRNIDAETAAYLVTEIPESVKSVGLFVDPADSDLERILGRVKLDILQLHGEETLERVQEIRKKFGFEIIKAQRIASKEDVKKSQEYEEVVDCLMFDARPKGHSLPGGTGQCFDWSLLQGHEPSIPWFLAGGLTPDNVGEAIRMLNPGVVDVSSGVEQEAGEKDPEKIRAFLHAVKSA